MRELRDLGLLDRLDQVGVRIVHGYAKTSGFGAPAFTNRVSRRTGSDDRPLKGPRNKQEVTHER